jgi:hypothetical protein
MDTFMTQGIKDYFKWVFINSKNHVELVERMRAFEAYLSYIKIASENNMRNYNIFIINYPGHQIIGNVQKCLEFNLEVDKLLAKKLEL